ncbi:hypothetical protein M0R45_001527 [Rubus argutus]|uniref:MYB transcription factor n=1 Tax=Rubus argutus TaxID=59490 RepID=A0AAW1VM69_RUBAR
MGHNGGRGREPKPQKWTAKEEEALLAGVVKHGAGKWKIILEDSEFGPFLNHRSNRNLKDKWRRLRSLGGTSTTVRTSGNYKPWRRSSVRSWGNYKPFRAAEALKEPQTISETNEAQRISKPADQDTESMLQLASQILERCSRR